MPQVHISADDFGLSKGVNRSHLELLAVGALSSTTVMMAGNPSVLPDKDDVLPFKNHFGIHLQLTSGKPLSTATGLTNDEGLFIDKDQVSALNPTAVESEWSLQIHTFHRHFGFWPKFLDSHHGVHTLPEFSALAQTMANMFAARIRPAKGTPGLITSWTGTKETAQDLALHIKAEALKSDTIEVVTHPGLDTQQLTGKTSWTSIRDHEHNALLELKANWNRYLPGFELV